MLITIIVALAIPTFLVLCAMTYACVSIMTNTKQIREHQQRAVPLLQSIAQLLDAKQEYGHITGRH